MGLRARRREELLASVRTAAMAELTRSGPTALSLRAVAREVGIAVSALYRYFPSRDDLLTELIVQAFNDQADEVESAARTADSTPAAAIQAALMAYRDWSLANPAAFALLYGTPVAGYQAPAERTVQAGTRVGELLVALLTQAQHGGMLSTSALAMRAQNLPAATANQLAALAQRLNHDVAPEVLAVGIDLYIRFHGLVVMEAFGQLRPLMPDATPYAREIVATEVGRLFAD
jgi:AcrR family transcriptional regulator